MKFQRPIKRLSRMAVLAAAFGAALWAIPGPSGGPASATGETPQTYLGSGSDVAYHVMSSLDLLYNESPGCQYIVAPPATQPLDFSCQAAGPGTENETHDQIREAFPIGGSAGVGQLCKQTLIGVAPIDFARQTANPTVPPPCTGLHYVAYARDAMTWEAFPTVKGSATATMNNQSGLCKGSSGFCLTQAQLQGIFVNCTITNWHQVGGANHAIVIYSVLPQYGTRKAWDLFLGGSSSSCPNVKLIDQTNNEEIAPADLPYAIVPVSVGSWRERYGALASNKSVLGLIDGVVSSVRNERNGSFPYLRYLFNVYCAGDPANSNKCGNDPTAAPQELLNYIGENGWLCTASAHAKDPITGLTYRTMIARAILQYGFAPLPKGPTGGGTLFDNFCRLLTT